MKVGCGEWGFREIPLERHFAIAQELGMRWLEIGIGGGQLGRFPEQPAEEDRVCLQRWSRQHDIEAPFCCLENDFTLPDPKAHQRMLENTLAGMRHAEAMGATHVRLFAGFTPMADMTEALWSQMLDAFDRCEQLAEQFNMVIAIETHGRLLPKSEGAFEHVHTVSTDRTGLRRLLEELPTRVGFNYDPGNLKPLADGDPLLRLDLLDDRIVYCHLKDWRRVGQDSWTAVAVGDDDLDYAPLLEQMSFDGVYLIEYEPTHDVVDGIQRSLKYLASLLPIELR